MPASDCSMMAWNGISGGSGSAGSCMALMIGTSRRACATRPCLFRRVLSLDPPRNRPMERVLLSPYASGHGSNPAQDPSPQETSHEDQDRVANHFLSPHMR